MAYVANSPLGKIIAVLLIVYYTSIRIVYGLLMCSLSILYYQYEYIKNTDMNTHLSMQENFSTIQSPEDPAVAGFRDQYCKKGILMNKGSPVNLEMLEHIYPDINFKYEKCNPCEDTCKFSIIEEQIKAEEGLKPKTSDDFSISALWEKVSYLVKLSGHKQEGYLGKIGEQGSADFIPALWVKSEPFTLLDERMLAK
jgi:hypothetical protein